MEDKIFLNRASELAAEIAFAKTGVSSDDLCRMQSAAMKDDAVLNGQELPFLERNGFSRAGGTDGCSTYVREDGWRKATVVIRPDGLREFIMVVKTGAPEFSVMMAGSSRESVMDAVIGAVLHDGR